MRLHIGLFEGQRSDFDVGDIAHQQHVAEQGAIVMQDRENAHLQIAPLRQLHLHACGTIGDALPIKRQFGQLGFQRLAGGDRTRPGQHRAHRRIDVGDAAHGVDHDVAIRCRGGDFLARHGDRSINPRRNRAREIIAPVAAIPSGVRSTLKGCRRNTSTRLQPSGMTIAISM